MRPADKKIEKLINNLNDQTRPELDAKILDKCFTELNTPKSQHPTKGPNIWSIIMHSKITKPIAAAIILIAGFLSLTIFNNTVPQAYAFEDTIKAHNSIRWLHVRESYAFSSGAPRTSDIWLECDAQGTIIKMRFQSDEVGEPIGPLIFTGNPENSEALLARHHLRLTGYGKIGPNVSNVFLRYDISELDPKFIFGQLQERHDQGEVVVDIFEPDGQEESIVITVTYPQGNRSHMWKKVIYVESKTKLISKIEKYENRSQGFELRKTFEFFDYNQPIEENMFTLDQDVTAHTRTINLSEKEAGLPQDNMTDKEIAEKVTRDFFEAVINKDYDRAGQFYLAAPGFLVEQGFMGANVLKILSVGLAHRDPDPDSNVMNCSCKVLIEHSGRYFELDAFMVRLIKSNKDENRWLICGMGSSVNPAYGMTNLSPVQNGLNDATYDGLMPGEFMKKWLVLGPLPPYEVPGKTDPFSKEGQKEAFDTDTVDPVHFAPRVTFDNGNRKVSAEWSLVETNSHAIDLNQLDADKSDFQIAYLCAQVEMPEDRTVTLGIGSDDGVKVWLNGELVHKNWLYRGVVVDNDHVQVTFKKGMNQLVLKVQNALGPWGFCCRILDE